MEREQKEARCIRCGEDIQAEDRVLISVSLIESTRLVQGRTLI